MGIKSVCSFCCSCTILAIYRLCRLHFSCHAVRVPPLLLKHSWLAKSWKAEGKRWKNFKDLVVFEATTFIKMSGNSLSLFQHLFSFFVGEGNSLRGYTTAQRSVQPGEEDHVLA